MDNKSGATVPRPRSHVFFDQENEKSSNLIQLIIKIFNLEDK